MIRVAARTAGLELRNMVALNGTPLRVRMFGFALVVTLSAALGGTGALQSFDYKLLDEQFAWLRYDQSRIADSTLTESVGYRCTKSSGSSGDGTGSRGGAKIVLMGFDEETVREFPQWIALWHHHLGDFLSRYGSGTGVGTPNGDGTAGRVAVATHSMSTRH
ncbi:MAG: hypothetical protein ACI8PT_002187 [Gammaproteobacteria bacterium]|jgi:hypothetical protein